ncbi:MAG: division/cell wall cluster transcriptional repressor MraZ [Candidatus Marinimicrobia bacterium]|nr:division/cell wall cluster transcriptional repressor MraZ [Candidatus Neomarinimicrobiota bacterium]RKY60978.1 MAG: division/cell wall cluster transcriptional repressor MraZ [Candidatus Neomarinimicrobiota bacterium]
MITTFAGESKHFLDDKNRLSIPAKFRRWGDGEDPENAFFITKGSDPCLVAYPEPEWEIFTEKLKKLSQFKKKNRAFIRTWSRNSVRLKCDKQGRVLIPQEHLDFAGIKKEVIIIGALNYLELWDPETLAKHQESQIPLDDDYYEDLADIL